MMLYDFVRADMNVHYQDNQLKVNRYTESPNRETLHMRRRIEKPQDSAYIISLFTNSSCNLFPNIAGLRSTITPADSNAEIFESAPPFPPLTMAPTYTLESSDANI